MDKFLREQRVPGVADGNKNEPLMPLGKHWNGYGQVVLGASLEKACESPAHLSAAIAAFPANSPYVLTYRADKDKVFVVLRAGADKAQALEGAFLAHLWLSKIHESGEGRPRQLMHALPVHGAAAVAVAQGVAVPGARALDQVLRSRKEMWRDFSEQAVDLGWNMPGTMLAIGDTRLLPQP